MRFSSEIMIDAAPADVWGKLVNKDALVEGDLGILRIEGDIQAGNTIRLWAEISPERAFTLKVSEFEPNSKMVWSSGMPLGLFKGVRRFTLTPKGDSTHFFMEEEFSGLMLPLIAKSIPDLNPAFQQFAKGLKELSTSS